MEMVEGIERIVNAERLLKLGQNWFLNDKHSYFE